MNQIICPNCSHSFDIAETVDKELQAARVAATVQLDNERKAMQAKIEEEKAAMKVGLEDEKNKMRIQMQDFLKQKDVEFEEKIKIINKEKQELEKITKQRTEAEFELKLKAMEEDRQAKMKQVQDLQRSEIDLLRQKEALELKQKEFDLELEKKMIEGRKLIEQEIAGRQQEVFDLKMKEKESQLDSMKKTIEDLKRKSEQGSMQLQGEAQELMLEEALAAEFPLDTIVEVGKGVGGADCILEVRNRVGMLCGTIIFESKNTKNWAKEWIDKLKTDKRTKSADVAVLVTQAFPKGMEHYKEIEGVWVCGFKEVIPLVHVLRNGIMAVHEAQKSQENKGDKMVMLYEFLTGVEFKGQLEGIVEGFLSMKNSIEKERMVMEKIWKEREKQISKVLLSTSGMYGSIKGIAGTSVDDIPLLEGE